MVYIYAEIYNRLLLDSTIYALSIYLGGDNCNESCIWIPRLSIRSQCQSYQLTLGWHGSHFYKLRVINERNDGMRMEYMIKKFMKKIPTHMYIYSNRIVLSIEIALLIRSREAFPQHSRNFRKHQAPVPLSIFRSNSIFGENSKHSGVTYIRGRSQRYFAHVTTVSLLWRVQNIVVIGGVYSEL